VASEDKRSEATKRQEELAKELGIDTYARYPRELIEDLMDRPPKEPASGTRNYEKLHREWEQRMEEWKPIPDAKERVYWAWVRHSWCWPICLAYAVATDERDEIMRAVHPPHHPVLFSEQAVADELGLSQQRVNVLTLDLQAEKRLTVKIPEGRKSGLAVFPNPKLAFTPEERSRFYKSTLVKTGIDGPRLEPAVERRFASIISQLGDKTASISVPPDGSDGDQPQVMLVGDYSTLVWRRVIDNRTRFLSGLKTLRYSERKAYANIATQVHNLISQSQSPDSGVRAAAANSTPPVAAAKSPSAEAKVSATQPPVAPEAQARQKPAKMEAAGEVLKRMPEVPAPDPQIEHLANVLGDWLETTIPYESARVLLDKCRKRVPQAQPPISDEEVLAVCSDIVLGKGGLRSANWKRLDNPMGLFVEVAPTYFPKALQNRRSTKA